MYLSIHYVQFCTVYTICTSSRASNPRRVRSLLDVPSIELPPHSMPWHSWIASNLCTFVLVMKINCPHYMHLKFNDLSYLLLCSRLLFSTCSSPRALQGFSFLALSLPLSPSPFLLPFPYPVLFLCLLTSSPSLLLLPFTSPIHFLCLLTFYVFPSVPIPILFSSSLSLPSPLFH